MALFLFTRAILAGEPVRIFNNGLMSRDFTYIDDVVDAVTRIIDSPPAPDPGWDGLSPNPGASFAPYRIYNIGNNKPVQLLEFLAIIEEVTGRKAKREYLPMQPGDVRATYAEIEDLARDFNLRPRTPLREGIKSFVSWYKNYYGIKE